jgi:hypothetical protein
LDFSALLLHDRFELAAIRLIDNRDSPRPLFASRDYAKAQHANQRRYRGRAICGRLDLLPVAKPAVLVKMLVDAESNRIPGFTAVDAQASEMMMAVQTAVCADYPTQCCAMRFSPYSSRGLGQFTCRGHALQDHPEPAETPRPLRILNAVPTECQEQFIPHGQK